MPDYPDTYADTMAWKPLPVPAEDVSVQCALQPVRVTFKDAPIDTIGWLLRPGDAIPIKSGQEGHIRPADSMGGVLIMESIG